MCANSSIPSTFEIVSGVSVRRSGRYLPQNFVGWALIVLGFGLLSTLTVTSTRGAQIGFQVICGIGLGMIWPAPSYPVLAPLPASETAHALALFAFVRNFAQTFGVTIGSAILQNELKEKLPAAFLDSVSTRGVELAYSLIPNVGRLPELLRSEVRDAFAGSAQVIWRVMLGVAVAGFLCVFAMKEVKMRGALDKDWGVVEVKQEAEQAEKA